MSDEKQREEKHNGGEEMMGGYLAMGVGIGVALGAAFGLAMDNMALGIPFGISIGAGIGIALGEGKKKKEEDAGE